MMNIIHQFAWLSPSIFGTSLQRDKKKKISPPVKMPLLVILPVLLCFTQILYDHDDARLLSHARNHAWKYHCVICSDRLCLDMPSRTSLAPGGLDHSQKVWGLVSRLIGPAGYGLRTACNTSHTGGDVLMRLSLPCITCASLSFLLSLERCHVF